MRRPSGIAGVVCPRSGQPWPSPIVAALIDNQLRELTYPVEHDILVQPLGMDDRDGSRIYRRSPPFLLVVAASELSPTA